MKKISLLTCSAALLWPLSLSAQTCTTPPSCDTLGYKQAASDCSGQQMLKCPFDNSKVFCGGAACSDDFKLTSCNTSIGNYTSCGGKCKYTSCNTGWYLSNGKCIENACSGYSIDAKMNCASYTTCKKGAYTVYKCSQCNDCWEKNEGICNLQYTTTKDSNAASFDSCTEGSTTKYKPVSCKSGYQLCPRPTDGSCQTFYNNCEKEGWTCSISCDA